MKELELVIRIPEEMYEQIKDSNTIFRDDERTCYEAVKNGIPLPKGHGDLIDKDALYAQFEYADYDLEKTFYDFEKALEYAQPIIEADKRVEE